MERVKLHIYIYIFYSKNTNFYLVFSSQLKIQNPNTHRMNMQHIIRYLFRYYFSIIMNDQKSSLISINTEKFVYYRNLSKYCFIYF